VSDPINWRELGRKTQEAASNEARIRAAAEEQKKQERIRIQQQKDAANAATAGVMTEVRAQCGKIAEQFNSAIREPGLKMTISDEVHMGLGIMSFIVRKESGFPRVKIDFQDEGRILVSLTPTKAPADANSETERYKVDENGQAIGSDGTQTFTADDISARICKSLLEAKYLS
jgi:hypothetical protein